MNRKTLFLCIAAVLLIGVLLSINQTLNNSQNKSNVRASNGSSLFDSKNAKGKSKESFNFAHIGLVECYVKEVPLQLGGKSVLVKIFTNEKGEFIRVESVNKVDDPFRRTPQSIEKQTQGSIRIDGLVEDSTDFSFDKIWLKIDERYSDLMTASNDLEFSLTLVNYREHENVFPMLILNMWGVEDPLGLRYVAPPPPSTKEGWKVYEQSEKERAQRLAKVPEIAFNRVRVFLDLEGNVLSQDNML